MNFGSEFALHDSDDEEEAVTEDAPAVGPLSMMSPVPPPPPQPPQPRVLAGIPSVGLSVPLSRPSPCGLLGPPRGMQHQHQHQHQQLATSAARGAGRGAGRGSEGGGWGARAVPFSLSYGAPAQSNPTVLRRGCSQRATPRAEAASGHGEAAPAAASAAPSSGARIWTRKVNTNILNVDMAALGNAAPFATGDPTFCSDCRACLSIVSVLRPVPTAAGVIGEADAAGEAGAVSNTAGTSLLRALDEYATGSGKGETNEGTSDGSKDARKSAAVEGGGMTAIAEETVEYEDGVYDWRCEFCGVMNRVELDDMEKPVEGQESVDYVLEPAPIPAAAAATVAGDGKSGGEQKDESAVLFVVDTSGSMCVTTAVKGRISLRGDRTKDMNRLLAAGDSRNQLMPGQRRGFTYVSRLQSIQAAIDAQLETMAESTPSRHAGIVTFSGEVSLIGDGSGDARVVAGDRLSDREALREVGRAYPLSQPVSQARNRLADRLFALEEGGPTALGPAVVAGLSMLKERGGRGSRMVLCTDGLANVGLGALDDLRTDEERTRAETFYETLGRESAENGVVIDVVSVDSDACDLENLGTMADVSGGTVTRVKASELTSNFAGILANPILASQVSVRVTLHKGLMFRNADVDTSANTLDRDIGNVTRETELNFEYQVRSKAERQARGIGDDGVLSSPADPAASAPAGNGDGGDTAAPAASHTDPTVRASKEPKVETQGGKGLNEANHTSLPFQVQIRYTRPDGMKCIRVLTKTQRVTRSKVEAEKSMQMAVVAGHAASQAGSMASRGAYHSTRVSVRAWNNLMQRNARDERSREQVSAYSTAMASLDNEIYSAQAMEGTADGDDGGAVDDRSEIVARGEARRSARSNNDSLSHAAYSSKGRNAKGFK